MASLWHAFYLLIKTKANQRTKPAQVNGLPVSKSSHTEGTTQCSFKLMAKSADSFFIPQSYQLHHLFLQQVPHYLRGSMLDTKIIKTQLLPLSAVQWVWVPWYLGVWPCVNLSFPVWAALPLLLQDRVFYIYTVYILQSAENGFPIALLKKP